MLVEKLFGIGLLFYSIIKILLIRIVKIFQKLTDLRLGAAQFHLFGGQSLFNAFFF